jgi:hypothetical protein
MPNVLQVNFKLTVSVREWRNIADELAPMFVSVPGLTWKIWGLNEATAEVAGVYLFESPEALNAFATGPIAAQIGKAPFLTDLSLKTFEVMAEVTALTRGPVSASRTAEPAIA